MDNYQDDSLCFHGPTYSKARIATALDFLSEDLRIPPSRINVSDAQMCLNPERRILWINVNDGAAKLVFQHAAKANNRDLNVIQFIPGPAIERKKAIDIKMKELRKTDPELRYQVRIGTDDLEIWTKHQVEGYYNQYKPIDIRKIDPMREFPEIKSKGIPTDPNQRNLIKESVAKLDQANKSAARSDFEPESSAAKTSTDDSIIPEDEMNGYSTVSYGKRKPSPLKDEQNKLKKLSSSRRILKEIRRNENGEETSDDDSDDESEKTVIERPEVIVDTNPVVIPTTILSQ